MLFFFISSSGIRFFFLNSCFDWRATVFWLRMTSQVTLNWSALTPYVHNLKCTPRVSISTFMVLILECRLAISHCIFSYSKDRKDTSERFSNCGFQDQLFPASHDNLRCFFFFKLFLNSYLWATRYSSIDNANGMVQLSGLRDWRW